MKEPHCGRIVSLNSFVLLLTFVITIRNPFVMQAEFLRDALYRFLPSATLDRVNRVIKRLQTGKFEGTLGRSAGNAASSSR